MKIKTHSPEAVTIDLPNGLTVYLDCSMPELIVKVYNEYIDAKGNNITDEHEVTIGEIIRTKTEFPTENERLKSALSVIKTNAHKLLNDYTDAKSEQSYTLKQFKNFIGAFGEVAETALKNN